MAKSKGAVKLVKKKIGEKLEIYKNDEEICKQINLALKRITLYNTRIYKKISIYKSILEKEMLILFQLHFQGLVG
ncbi:hypothetical protein [uncultured Methanobrevibacter sp.]|uniref:hypothetical protein n=1 Tax=uncultured Methanobrevibacter sp. TaxID=253161 RepID=UPI0025DBE8CB|nr:hypothetical protein [uncultured Methanobrevibacter sp.]